MSPERKGKEQKPFNFAHSFDNLKGHLVGEIGRSGLRSLDIVRVTDRRLNINDRGQIRIIVGKLPPILTSPQSAGGAAAGYSLVKNPELHLTRKIKTDDMMRMSATQYTRDNIELKKELIDTMENSLREARKLPTRKFTSRG